MPALRLDLLRHGVHRLHHVGPARDHLDPVDAHQAVQEVVAARLGLVASGHPLFQDKTALEPFPDRSGQRQAAVVGLHGSARDEKIRPFFQGIGRHELQLADLVAAGGKPQLVVALDEEVRPAQGL